MCNELDRTWVYRTTPPLCDGPQRKAGYPRYRGPLQLIIGWSSAVPSSASGTQRVRAPEVAEGGLFLCPRTNFGAIYAPQRTAIAEEVIL